MENVCRDVFEFASVQEAFEGFKDSMDVRMIIHGIFGKGYQVSKATIQQTYSVDGEMVEKAIGREKLERQIYESFKKSINEEAKDWVKDPMGNTFEEYGERLMSEHEKCVCKIKFLGEAIVSKTMENLLTCDIHTGELQRAIEALCIRTA